MGTHTVPPHPASGFLERHRVVTALSAVLLVALIGALVGTGVALVLTTLVRLAASAFTSGG